MVVCQPSEGILDVLIKESKLSIGCDGVIFVCVYYCPSLLMHKWIDFPEVIDSGSWHEHLWPEQ